MTFKSNITIITGYTNTGFGNFIILGQKQFGLLRQVISVQIYPNEIALLYTTDVFLFLTIRQY